MKIVELFLKEENKGEGITAISLVKHPAIEHNWIAFSENGGEEFTPNLQYAFKTINEEQRVIAGPAMVPDKLIYRLNEKNEESFVFFKANTIRELSERFLYQGKQSSMTLEHESTVNDLAVVESWIVEDSEKDKSTMYGFSLPVGSWFVKVKVLNDDVWSMVKGKQVAGFSVEGVFASELIENSKPMKTEKLNEYLDRIKALFADEKPAEEPPAEDQEEQKFGSIEATNADGTEVTVNFPGEALEVGAAITHTVEGEEVALPTGEWTLADGGTLIVTEEGVVAELRVSEEEPAEEKEMKTEPEAEGLSEKQMEALIDGIATVVAQFKTDVTKQVEEAVKTATETLRAEFNKPAVEQPEEPTPEDDKRKIVKGLGKFVQEAKE